jgi:hypothetical protein
MDHHQMSMLMDGWYRVLTIMNKDNKRGKFTIPPFENKDIPFTRRVFSMSDQKGWWLKILTAAFRRISNFGYNK